LLGIDERAAEDLRYLLSRGYGRISAVKFVGDKYKLDKPQRLLLYRGVYAPEGAAAHLKKLIGSDGIRQKKLSVDGFNVLLTVNSELKGIPNYLCDDGLVRDVSEIHSAATKENLSKPLDLTISALRDLEAGRVYFVFDRLISRSGELSKQVSEEMRVNSIAGESLTAESADFEVLRRGEIAASSDSIIIDKADRVFDLAAYVITKKIGHAPPKI